jgi:uncharacterized protein involved in exopolysaccharide biosynthesis/Mrp family chromosome partitioning ATPase
MDIDANPAALAIVPRAPAEWQFGANQAQRGLTGGDLVNLLRRNAWIILGCAVVAAVLAFGFASTLDKYYTAECDIAVGGERVAIPQLQGVLESGASTDPMPQVHTEVQALQAQQLLIGLVNELHLERVPEFNSALRPTTIFGTIFAGIKSVFPASNTDVRPEATRDAIVNAVSRALNITQDNKSLVIGVTFTAEDPHLAATVVNRLVSDYVGEIARRRADADTGANAAMMQRINDVSNEIKQLEQQERQLRASSGTIALRAGSIGQQRVEDLTIEESRQAIQRSELEANLARASAAAASGNADELASVLESPTISRLREQEAEASGNVANMSAQYGANFPGLQSAQANLNAIRGQLRQEAARIVASLSTQLKAAREHEASVKAELAEARKGGAESQDVLAQLSQLDQDIVARRTLYASLLQSAQQTMAQPHSDSLPDVRVLSVASVPGLPSYPNKKLAVGFGGLAGVLIGGLIGLKRHGAQSFFKNESDLASLTGATILAKLRGGSRNWDRLALPAVTEGPYASSLRTALALMRSMGNAAPPRVLALVGTQIGRQTAAVAVSLARIAAADGLSVLLIEAGSGRGNLSKLLVNTKPLPRRQVDTETSWRDKVVRESASNLAVLFDHLTGKDASSRTVALENLLLDAREEYDLVLLGAPEIGEAEAIELARSCDLTVLVVDLAVATPTDTNLAAGHLASVSRSRLGAIVLGTT